MKVLDTVYDSLKDGETLPMFAEDIKKVTSVEEMKAVVVKHSDEIIAHIKRQYRLYEAPKSMTHMQFEFGAMGKSWSFPVPVAVLKG